MDDDEWDDSYIKIIKESLDSELSRGIINGDDFSKEIVDLAYEYIMNGRIEKCINLLISVQDDYFATTAFKHFKEDEGFFIKTNAIFEILLYGGYVQYDLMATQAPAKA